MDCSRSPAPAAARPELLLHLIVGLGGTPSSPQRQSPFSHPMMRPAIATAARSRRRWLQLVVLVSVLAFIALLAYGLRTSGASTAIDESLAREEAPPAPGFSLPILESGTLPPGLAGRLEGAFADGQLSLDELEGVPVLLNFWASWCIPCREEAPLLQEGWRRYGRQGVLFLGLDMQDLTGDARDFLREFSISYPTIREPSNGVARTYGVTGIPETFFIAPDGNIVSHVIGVISEEQLAAGVAAAKSGEVVGALEGGDIRPQR